MSININIQWSLAFNLVMYYLKLKYYGKIIMFLKSYAIVCESS